VPHRYSKFLNTLQILGDLLVLNLAFLYAYYYKFQVLDILSRDNYFELFAFYNISWLLLTALYQPFQISRTDRLSKVLRRQLSITVIHLLLITAFFVLGKAYYFSREHILLTYLSFGLLDFTWKAAFFYLLRMYRKQGFNYRNVVIMGYGELAEDLIAYFRAHPEFGYRFIGAFDNQKTGKRIKGKMDDLKKFVQENHVDEVYCCLPYVRYTKVKELVDFGDANLLKVKLIADFRGFSFKGVELERYDHIPVLNITNIPLDDLKNQIVKRAFDVIFSSLVIIFIFSWLFPLLAIAIRMESKGPVFFKQKRTGIKNKSFWCYKFRSMYVNAESNTLQASKNDKRITRIGAILRKTSLDELPQFINVLLGEMSVVGPRPHMLSHTQEYSKVIEKFMARHFVKPGITGLAQAKGFRGETQDNINLMKNRIRLDRFYVSNWSLIFDVRIIYLTVVSMVKGEDRAY
jgi:putative colanic acid biosynthesis UDP-glucose lipid carrier transferase